MINLPPEVNYLITTYSPLIWRRINNYYKDITNYDYLKLLCERPISYDELVYYVDEAEAVGYCIQLPTETVSTIYHFYDNEELVEVDTIMASKEKSEIYYSTENEGIGEDDFYEDIEKYDQSFILDLVTEYNIRSNRLGCVNLNPEYAKEWVFKQLTNISKQITNAPDLWTQVQLYIILSTTAEVIGIEPSYLTLEEFKANNIINRNQQLLETITQFFNNL